MIDTDKYEGHTPATWWMPSMELRGSKNPVVKIASFKREPPLADRLLIMDAPLLLAEVKRLREIIGVFDEFMCNNWMPSNSYPHAPSPFDNVHSLWNELLWRVEEE